VEKVNVGKIIKQARIDKDISQRDLAKELGVTPAALSAWETNKRNPPIQTLIILAKRLEIIDELFGRNSNTNNDEIKKIWQAISRIEKKLESIK